MLNKCWILVEEYKCWLVEQVNKERGLHSQHLKLIGRPNVDAEDKLFSSMGSINWGGIANMSDDRIMFQKYANKQFERDRYNKIHRIGRDSAQCLVHWWTSSLEGKKKALICSFCWLPWYKYSYHANAKLPMWCPWTHDWEELLVLALMGQYELVPVHPENWKQKVLNQS